MRLSIQSKFTLSLLATSLSAVLLVGLVARGLVLRDFNQMVQEDAFSRFRIGVTRYVKAYGTLENALQKEPFPEFQVRNESQLSRSIARPSQWSEFRGPDAQGSFGAADPGQQPGGGPGQPAGGSFAPSSGGFGEQHPGPGGGPHGWEGGGPEGEPHDWERRGPGGGPQGWEGRGPESGPQGWGGGGPGEGPRGWGGGPEGGPQGDGGPPFRATAHPADQDESGAKHAAPPYRFMLLDAGGHVRGGESNYPLGSLVPASVRNSAQPIIVGGKVAALAVPDANPNLTRRDQAYLAAMSQALWYALGVTFLIAVAIGAVVGRRLGRDLGILAQAMKAVGEGSLGQEVRIHSRDEVGVLAGSFNWMSTELVRAREELEQSAAQIREQAARLQELSIRDGLTGLFNRRFFDEQAVSIYAQSRRYQQPLTFAVGDIDYFKRINDKFSHAVGDEVLRRVAALLRSTMRESDVVARYGGEEFVLALPNTSASQAAVACNKLRHAIEAHPWHEIHPDLRVTMSLGLCDRLGLGGPEQMIGAADTQLYRSKEEGRNRVSWEKPLTPAPLAAEPQGILRQGHGV